ncbi:IS66 family transposase [Loigolactobacillus coryniformis]|nr:IS66 family transposase [Loigolactobacillus coryniformis]
MQSKSYIGVVRSTRLAERQIIYYTYDDTRSGKFAQQLYMGFRGVLQCDGYSGYNQFGDSIDRVGCWAHVRRKFFDDANKVKDHFIATKLLSLLNKMFQLEQDWRKLSPDLREQQRFDKLKPLIDQFW